MTDATIAPGYTAKITELQEAQQRRLNEIAQADSVWAHLAGQIEALTWAQTGESENGSVEENREP